MSGLWVFICGPSGSGKDSVIATARQLLASHAGIVFSRRIVTRPAQAGSDHDPMTETAFDALMHSNGLSWHWQAHGFRYGVARRYADEVQQGRTVVVNGSRGHVTALPPSADRRLVSITANATQLAERLARRGRDSANAIDQRLARNSQFKGLGADHELVNDGELLAAGQQLARYLASVQCKPA